MNVLIINLIINVLFRVSFLYLIVKVIEEIGVIVHYMNDVENQEYGTYIYSVLILDVLLKIIIYLCLSYSMIWVYSNFDISISINASDVLELI